jgi:hypothetical protein
MNDKNCLQGKLRIFLMEICNLTFRQFTFLISTGTRIRTQIKGFGDPYATVAPCPCISHQYLSLSPSVKIIFGRLLVLELMAFFYFLSS